MVERFQERNWDPSSREKENQSEEYLRYQGHRPAWRPAYYGGYGASLAQEIPFYGTEQYGSGQMFQQPYAPSIPQPFPGVLPQQLTPQLQQPFVHQPFAYGLPLQQPFYGMNLQQPMPMGMQQPIPQTPMHQPFGMGMPQHPGLQQQIPQGIQQPFGQQLQQPFLPQSSPFAQIPQQQIAFPQSSQQPFGQQFQGQQLQQLQRGRFTGRGPKAYRRPDERIREDAIERLTTHPDIDATNVDISVKNGEITLKGTIEDRLQKRLAEDLVETVFGVLDVQNQLRVEQTQWSQFQQSGTGSEREEFTSKGKEK